MGIVLDAYRSIQESNNEYRNKLNEKVQQHTDNIELDRDRIQSLKENMQNRKNLFSKYKEDVKFKLMYESLCSIYDNSIKNISESERILGHNLVASYINENGVDFIINSAKDRTFFLNELCKTIEKYYTKITEDATEEDIDSQKIDPSTYDSFCKELNGIDDVDDITNTIRIRVANAEEEFLTSNLVEKENTEDIIKATKDRIESIKQDSETYNDPEADTAGMQEEVVNMQKDAIYKLRIDRQKGVFEQMVNNLSAKSLRDYTLRESFCNKTNGGLDMDKIVESVRCMYTLIEMVNTSKLEKVDENYIKEMLNSI